MTLKVPLQGITLGRPNPDNPKKPLRINPEIGKPFEFTDDEIKQITARSPDAFRDVVNESAGGDAADAESAAPRRGRPPGSKRKGAGLEDL